LDQPLSTNFVRERSALLLAAHIAPDESRSHHPIFLVEHDRAVHLARKADASNVSATQPRLRQHLAHGNTCRTPPVARVLLRPSDLRRRKGSMLFGRGRNHSSLLIYDQCPRPAGAYINTQ
jgi:nitroreductase